MTQLHRFARGHRTSRRGTCDRGHRTRQIGGAADRRHRELDGAFAIWPDDAFEAEPQRRRITGERQFDGFAGQRLAFPGEQEPGSAVDVVAAAARPAGGIARPAPGEPPAPVPHPLFLLFYQVEIRHRQLSNDNPAPAPDAGICTGV